MSDPESPPSVSQVEINWSGDQVEINVYCSSKGMKRGMHSGSSFPDEKYSRLGGKTSRKHVAIRRPSADCLPEEVLEKIFCYLTLEQCMRVERVCKRWQDIAILSWRYGSKTIDFNKIYQPIPLRFRAYSNRIDSARKEIYDMVHGVFSRSQKSTQHIKFRNLKHLSEDEAHAALKALSRSIPDNLSTLDFSGSHFDAHDVARVFAAIPGGLKKLNLRYGVSGKHPGNKLTIALSELFNRSPNMTAFVCSGFRDSSCKFLVNLPESLEILRLTRCHPSLCLDRVFDGKRKFIALSALKLDFVFGSALMERCHLDVEKLAQSAPNIETLELASDLIDIVNGNGAKYFTKLRILDITNVQAQSALIRGITHPESACRDTLQNLNLDAFAMDEGAMMEVGKLRGLLHLNVNDLMRINGDVLRAIASGCTSLHALGWEYQSSENEESMSDSDWY